MRAGRAVQRGTRRVPAGSRWLHPRSGPPARRPRSARRDGRPSARVARLHCWSRQLPKRQGRVGGSVVKITAIEPLTCDGGLREFGFVKVTTDEGIVGWAETYDWHTSASLAAALRVMGRTLVGSDPRRIELFNERTWYGGRPGVPERIKVLAAIDLALYDIKAQWLGVPVFERLGGKFRDPIPHSRGPL